MKRVFATLAFLLALAGSCFGQAVAQSRTLSAATTNSTQITAGRTLVYMIDVSNHNTASRFLKFYDSSSAPTCGSGTPNKTVEVPGVTTSPTAAHVVLPYSNGLQFNKGLTFCITGAIADNDATAIGANDVVVNIDYR